MQKTVVLVHGIWMTGLEMGWLGRQLQKRGYKVKTFHYPSLMANPDESARKLVGFIRDNGLANCYFVGHSLGGIILLRLFQHYPEISAERVVVLGAPVKGSQVARNLSVNPVMHYFLGRSGAGLTGNNPSWQGRCELGVIAGDQGIGIGRLLATFNEPNDGTVAVSETRLNGADDFLVLPVSHMGMLVSKQVVEAICRFFTTGRFEPGTEAED